MFALRKSKSKSKRKSENGVRGDAYLDILMDLAECSVADKNEKNKKETSYIGRILGTDPAQLAGLKHRTDTDDTDQSCITALCDSPGSGASKSSKQLLSSPSSEDCPSRQLQILSSWDDDGIMIYYAQSPSPAMDDGAQHFTFSDYDDDDNDSILHQRTSAASRVSASGSDRAAARKEFYSSRVPDAIEEKYTFDSSTCVSF